MEAWLHVYISVSVQKCIVWAWWIIWAICHIVCVCICVCGRVWICVLAPLDCQRLMVSVSFATFLFLYYKLKRMYFSFFCCCFCCCRFLFLFLLCNKTNFHFCIFQEKHSLSVNLNKDSFIAEKCIAQQVFFYFVLFHFYYFFFCFCFCFFFFLTFSVVFHVEVASTEVVDIK